MILTIKINNQDYKIRTENSFDISIPLRFNGAQPKAFDVERAASKSYETKNLIGDTRRGGSCNFEQVTFIPHCNGTHTECIGHITHERISIHNLLKDLFIPSTLVTVEAKNAFDSQETYSAKLNDKDKLITKKTLEDALQKADKNFLQGLIIRTLPNDESKKLRNYMEKLPPFFSTEAIKFIAEKQVKHILVDMPSIDKTFDEGKLSNHRIFWNVEQGCFQTNERSSFDNTITEMIFVSETIQDDSYFLNLQIAPFVSDASPSRPILFRIFE